MAEQSLQPKQLKNVNGINEITDEMLLPVQKDYKWAKLTMGQFKEHVKTRPEDLDDVVQEARGLRDEAEQALEDAEAARDAILQAASFSGQAIFETVALGMAGTAENDFFWVIPNETDELSNMSLFKNDDADGEFVLENFTLNDFLIEEGEVWV